MSLELDRDCTAGDLAVASATAALESRLRDAEERYRLLFEGSPTPKWLFDTKTLRFLAVNDAAVAHYGYSRDEFLGMTILEIRPPEEVPRLVETLQSLGTEPELGVWKHRRRDGGLMDVDVRSHPFAMGARPCRLVVARDVTERRRLEAQFLQAQKMEAIGILAGGVAHDFNNLLSVILSYSSLLADDLEPCDPMREDLLCIRSAGERAAELTRQLLAFSRQQVLVPRVLDLNDVVVRLEKMLRRVIGEDVELVTIVAPAPTSACLDPGQIEQVVMNLSVNARDAMPDGGTLTIETASVLLDAAFAADHVGVTAGPHVRIAVADTGIGMDAATLARIFEPFFTTKDLGKGTGLGLSTVLGIVQQSGGTIWVKSEPGHGTTFTTYFPAATADASTTGEDEYAQGGRRLEGNETVLVVDDEEHIAQVACSILERRGYRVLRAHNGGDALLVCEQEAGGIDLLVTDVIMPRMNGPQLAARLAPLKPGMRVLYVSGYADRPLAGSDALVGGWFLQKPITPDTLVRKVREVLEAPENRPPRHRTIPPGSAG